MHEELKQKISQLLDNELGRDEALSLLQTVQSSPDLNNKLNRYESISHALKTEVFLLPDRDFTLRVRNAIESEPNYLIPQRKPVKSNIKVWATAASIAVIGVITGLNLKYLNDEDDKSAPVIPSSVMVSAVPVPSRPQVEPDSINKQINDYLQAHNSSVYINGQANFQPYARVTAYSQK